MSPHIYKYSFLSPGLEIFHEALVKHPTRIFMVNMKHIKT